MKRIAALLLTFAMCLSLLTGCGEAIEITLGGDSNAPTPPISSTPSEESKTPSGDTEASEVEPTDSESSSEEESSSEPEPVVDNRTMEEKYADAQTANSDTRGWIRIPYTYVDHAVVQGADNSFYLERDIYKSYNWYGSVFAHYGNNLSSVDSLDQNTILFGHNKNDGLVFGSLVNYADPGYATNHPVITMLINGVETKWAVFAAMDCETSFIYIRTALSDATIQEVRDRSYIDCDLSVSSSDKILTLSTCTYKYKHPSGQYREDVRFVVMAKLISDGSATPSYSTNGDRLVPSFAR